MVDIQSVAAEIRRGKKRKEDRKIKTTGQNIMACPITQGDHNEDRHLFNGLFFQNNLSKLAPGRLNLLIR